jgi:hypothetical protein
MIGRLLIAGSPDVVVTRCTSCGDASGWLRLGPAWGCCVLCNDEGEKPVPPFCWKCGATFPCCRCPRAKA